MSRAFRDMGTTNAGIVILYEARVRIFIFIGDAGCAGGAELSGGYLLAIGFGLLLGAIAGFFLTRRLANRLSW